MNWRDDSRWAYVLVNLSTAIWGSNFILGRVLRNEIGPLKLTAFRYIIAALLFGGLLSRSAVKECVGRCNWPMLLGMGLTGVFGFPYLLYRGLQLRTATNAVLINGTGPLMTVVLAAMLLKEKLLRRHVLGALVSLIGVMLIISDGSFRVLLRLQVNAGDLQILLAAGLWGLYSIFSRVATLSQSVLSATAFSIWITLPLLLVVLALEWQSTPVSWDWRVILAMIYIGIFPSVVANLAWNDGVRRVGPSRVMAFYNMLPVFGSIFGVVLLGESFGWPHMAGGSLVVVGSLISVWPDLMHSAIVDSPGIQR